MPTLARTRPRSRQLLLAGAILVALSVVLVFVQSRVMPLGPARSASVGGVVSLAETGSGVRNSIGKVWSGFFEADRLQSENELLREEIARLQAERALARQEADSWRAKATMMEERPREALRTRGARVVASIVEGRSRLLWIGLGTEDGLEAGQAVLAPGGVVGAVRELHPHHAIVQLLTDEESRWGGEVPERGEFGIVAGNGNSKSLEFELEQTTTSIQPGDVVRTSGTRGSIVPEGIPLGTVTHVTVSETGERIAVLEVPEQAESLRYVYVLGARQLPWEPPRE